MKFQAFHVNPGEKLKKKDVNNDLSNFMSVFPNDDDATCVSEKLDTKSFGQFSKVHITSDKVLERLLIKAFLNKV